MPVWYANCVLVGLFVGTHKHISTDVLMCTHKDTSERRYMLKSGEAKESVRTDVVRWMKYT